ncbi:hypothetical protein P153DRAFT_226615 [Dothidotthia symphoricarpi CBS 119687]|uniref:Uncharacterized protein n=1 Tax=Dothidotthia symphoricarpi CBS 119687 TaxID=1392245 RepID=A0A6A6AFL3_9PLEO|nr:uncharacterized protein P153DRAFT_226615 [Dothidotthia symphoricarpi CBS 119687]KAF2129905.1 hypothetical protein P153DRAFT_226615 [Dothidotthia symphoricarpi CBS 119687]
MPETCTDARHEMDHLLLKNGANSFYPLDRLRDHFTPEKVKQILTCSCKTCREDVRLFGNQTDPETYVKEIVGEGFDPYDSRKTLFSVFGLLISVEHPLFIIGFADRDCSDFKLESWATDATLFSRETLQRYTGSYKTDARKFEWFATKFEDSIRRFAVPHMDSGKFVHYDASVILPFVKEREIGKRKEEDGHWTSEGANGKVFAFKIHPEYCKFRVSLTHRSHYYGQR